MSGPSIYEPGDRPNLFENPAIFLSASVPFERLETGEDGARLSTDEIDRNLRYLRTSQPARIRRAVTELCRFTFRSEVKYNLVFGGHPAISPLVLQAARQFVDDDGDEKRAIVFQSAYFCDKIPAEARELGNWERGQLLYTEGLETKAASLFKMRQVMLDRSHDLRAAILIGGMEGIIDEVERFADTHKGAPIFAIGSTGSASQDVLEERTSLCSGSRADAATLRENASYPQVMHRIFKDLETENHGLE